MNISSLFPGNRFITPILKTSTLNSTLTRCYSKKVWFSFEYLHALTLGRLQRVCNDIIAFCGYVVSFFSIKQTQDG